MKKILYVHGAFSAFKQESPKVKALSKNFEVFGINYSMENTFFYNLKIIESFCFENEIDFIVGTSLGGLFATEVGSILNIPSVLINPCVEPIMSLSTIIGEQKNYTTGLNETLTKELVETYPDLATVSVDTLIFLGMKDDLIDSMKTKELFEDKATIFTDEKEDHYWETFNENEIIEFFMKDRL